MLSDGDLIAWQVLWIQPTCRISQALEFCLSCKPRRLVVLFHGSGIRRLGMIEFERFERWFPAASSGRIFADKADANEAESESAAFDE